ncbi:MAG: membrane protein insertase YidC [Hyphomicrobiaceae bacterium]|nr:membrane protein insertase YidC [Hyphomicrobiaceae bacterium]
MSPDQRNMVIAVLLSIAVVFGWQYFVMGPQIEKAQQQAAATAQQDQANTDIAQPDTSANASTNNPAPDAAASTATFADREAALAATADRVQIETASITGSINLTGARLDDVSLKKYNEAVDPTSPIIHLLQPDGSPDGFFIETGWVRADGSSEGLPDQNSQWKLVNGSTLSAGSPVTLEWDNGAGLVFKRTITVDDDYLFSFSDSVENNSGGDIALFPYSRVVRQNLPHDLANFFILHEGPIGVMGGSNLQEKTYKDLDSEGTIQNDATGGWLGFTDKYWAAVIMPEDGTDITARFVHTPTASGPGIYRANFIDKTPVTVASGGTANNVTYAFAGAKVEAIIDGYEQAYGFDSFELMIDWGWFHFITKPMFFLIRFLYSILGNFGLAILSVTLIVKALFLPLANRSYASMAKMRKVQPEMKALQERYADDRAEQQKQIMELYSREKINPLSGCWPILIQIPVFFSLYKVLFITIEMRHAPFFGWIQDLAAKDPTNVFNLFGLIPFDPTVLPVVGGFLHLGFWPLLMGITMWVQMRLNPPQTDPTQQMIFNLMPIFFTFMLGSFPAGLVIYWAWNNTLSIAQQWFIMKRNGADVDLFGNVLSSLGLRKTATQKPGK